MDDKKTIANPYKGLKDFENEIRKMHEDPEAGLKGWVFFFHDGTEKLTIPYQYRKKKADGSFAKTKTEKGVIAQYCPFTGVKLY